MSSRCGSERVAGQASILPVPRLAVDIPTLWLVRAGHPWRPIHCSESSPLVDNGTKQNTKARLLSENEGHAALEAQASNNSGKSEMCRSTRPFCNHEDLLVEQDHVHLLIHGAHGAICLFLLEQMLQQPF